MKEFRSYLFSLSMSVFILTGFFSIDSLQGVPDFMPDVLHGYALLVLLMWQFTVLDEN